MVLVINITFPGIPVLAGKAVLEAMAMNFQEVAVGQRPVPTREGLADSVVAAAVRILPHTRPAIPVLAVKVS